MPICGRCQTNPSRPNDILCQRCRIRMGPGDHRGHLTRMAQGDNRPASPPVGDGMDASGRPLVRSKGKSVSEILKGEK